MANSAVLEVPRFQPGLETKILQETMETKTKSEEALLLSIKRECGVDDHRLENQSSGTPSQPLKPPNKGLFFISISKA